MAPKTKVKTKKPSKSTKSPHEIEKAKFSRSIAGFFSRLGFERVKTDGKEFKFLARTGELDDLFIYENILIVAEYTIGGSTTEHAAKKNLLWEQVHKNPAEWIDFLAETFPSFEAYFNSKDYTVDQYRIRVCYFSKSSVSGEVEECIPSTVFVGPTTFRYFDALGKTIHKSARHELFKFLEVGFEEIGEEIVSSSVSKREFKGFILPPAFSSFPKGFKVASFYADAAALLAMSFVLRRDSWRDPDGMYQRVLQRGRMKEMRRYLTSEERVFVNNIIVTLPAETKLNELTDSGKNLLDADQGSVKPVTVVVPFRSNAIGIIDGQHRVFCYHEGVDSFEDKIRKLRPRQNLLVTGIIFPNGLSETERQRFEAKLFLEINDKQKKAKSDLKQSIELILNPHSNVAIAKRIVEQLHKSGALKGMLQTNYFDPPHLIRTASIVSYGLRPLVKLGGSDSFYSSWKNPDKGDLLKRQKAIAGDADDPLLTEYISYCVNEINNLLLAVKKRFGPSWALFERPKDRELTPTVVNGLFVCLRLLIAKKQLYAYTTYEAKLTQLSVGEFKKFKSSQWGALGAALYKKHFE